MAAECFLRKAELWSSDEMTITKILHDKVHANGIEMHYRFTGQGAPIVLLHGWPQHSLMWNRVMAELADQYLIIAPDLRGAGGSSITPGGYDKRTMARDLRALIEKLNLGPVFLVGYDHGVGVAYQYAGAHPNDVRRLALAEYALPGFGYEAKLTPSRDWDVASSWQLSFFTQPDVAELFIRGKERELLSWFFWKMSANPEGVSGEDFEEYVRQIIKPGALRAGLNYYAAVWQDMDDHSETARRGKLQMPVLGIGGRWGFAEKTSLLLEPVAQHLSGTVIEGAGHWPADERPDEFARILRDFFQADSP